MKTVRNSIKQLLVITDAAAKNVLYSLSRKTTPTRLLWVYWQLLYKMKAISVTAIRQEEGKSIQTQTEKDIWWRLAICGLGPGYSPTRIKVFVIDSG